MDNYISNEEERKRVLVTGFAPFSGVAVNPSWEGVKAINKDEIECKLNITLITEKIQVCYDDVDLCVPKLWENHHPHLIIHVGVSDQTPGFLLETQAYKTGYSITDVNGLCPANCEACSDGPDSIATELAVDVICKEFNCSPPAEGLQADMSYDAGRYLCEYIYYTSLCRDTSKTLFIHVPHNNYTNEQIALGLERIIEICLRHLDCNK